MSDNQRQSVAKLSLQQERHVVHARQRARDLAALLRFDRLEQVRLATATSEIARNAFRYAREGTVEFFLSAADPPSLLIEVKDAGPGIHNLEEILAGRYQSKTGLGKGLLGTRKLMDHFEIQTSAAGTCVVLGKTLISGTVINAKTLASLQSELAKTEADPLQEVERQNQDLLRALAELREKQDQLARVNHELEDTNRGVVALYAELEQTATDLRRVSDLKTSFLSNLSHEFRTPLNSILALCGILHSRSDGDLTEEQERQVGYIRHSAADLSELVNDLLDVAKVEAGKVDIRASVFSVDDLFGALRGMLKTLLTGDAVKLIFTTSESLPKLFTDEQKLSQILRNLIANALKFTERGHIHISAQMEGGFIIFRVEDTGIGIAPADQERVFEEFAQVGGALQRQVQGTGLGLPLARRLAELLGGTLNLQSAMGQGSTFTVVLPVQFSPAQEPTVQPVVRQPNTPKVLLVEDNMETRFIHQAALRASPYTVQLARSLGEARTLISTAFPEAIVLDRVLDGTDSLPWIDELRSTGYRGPIIVVSVIDDAPGVMAAGADAFLVKPIAAGVLADLLASLLGATSAKSVLLVDDDEINRYVLREALQPYKFKLLEARSGREALATAADTRLSGVFLDLAMPGLTGIETLRELRRNPATVNLPVIIHSSKDLSDQELTTIDNLGAAVFPKKALNHPDAVPALRALLTSLEIL